MSAKHPDNGPTLTKGKPIRRPSLPPNPGREAAQLAIDLLDQARHKKLHELRKKYGLWGALERLKADKSE